MHCQNDSSKQEAAVSMQRLGRSILLPVWQIPHGVDLFRESRPYNSYGNGAAMSQPVRMRHPA